MKRKTIVNEYIMQALFILMKKKKYSDISITEITEKAGVGRVSFYRHFQSKEDIIQQWIDYVTEEFLKQSDISYQNDHIEDYFIKLFHHLNQYKEEAILIYKAGLIYLIKNQFDQMFIHIYKEIYDDYKSYFIGGGIFNIYYFWLLHGYQETPEELAHKLSDLLVK